RLKPLNSNRHTVQSGAESCAACVSQNKSAREANSGYTVEDLSRESMALFKVHSAAVYGIDAHLIDVEVDLYPSGTARDFITVGMPDTAVRESRERIKSALINSG